MNPSFHPDSNPELLIRFLSGECSAEERQQVGDWAQADPKHRQYLEEMTLLWQRGATAKDFADVDVAADWQTVRTRINAGREEENPQPVRTPNTWLYPLLKIAAVVVLALGMVIGLSDSLRQYLFDQEKVALATAGPLQVTLPDGTRVYLNKHARLTYPENFAGEKREVSLRGEAFFEVVKNEDQPFYITTGAVVTRVLGTSFTVNASAEDSVLVTVLTGKVALFERGREAGRITMTPGERGAYHRGTLTKTPNTDLNFLAWKTGTLTFRNTPLADVVTDLSRYYQQPVQLGTEGLETCELSSTFHRQTLEEVLAEMQLVLPVGIERRGDTTLITGEGCR